MYFAIDNQNQTLIGLHSNLFAICNLAWLYNCSDDAEIVIGPTDNLLSINDLSSETLDVFSGGVEDRFEALEEVSALLESQDETEVNIHLLELQAKNRPLDSFTYEYLENKTEPRRC